VSWKLVYTKKAQKDASKLAQCGLKKKAATLLAEYCCCTWVPGQTGIMVE